MSPQLSFYRDKSGLEIDLIREYQRRPFAMEIKAGATYVSNMVDSLKHFRSLETNVTGAALIYSGDDRALVDQIKIVPYSETAALLFPES